MVGSGISVLENLVLLTLLCPSVHALNTNIKTTRKNFCIVVFFQFVDELRRWLGHGDIQQLTTIVVLDHRRDRLIGGFARRIVTALVGHSQEGNLAIGRQPDDCVI